MEEYNNNLIIESIEEDERFKNNVCKKFNLRCNNTSTNIFKNFQKKLKKDNDYQEKGFLVVYKKRRIEYLILITDEKTTLNRKHSFKNDIICDYKLLIKNFRHIEEFNLFHEKLNKLVKKDKRVELVDYDEIKKISQLFKYDNLMLNQYINLEQYFDNLPKTNNLQNNIIEYFVHSLTLFNLEILLKGGGKFINPVSENTYDSERGIYTTLKSSQCNIKNWLSNLRPILYFSPQLVNDFGYYINFGYHFGIIDKNSLIKGEKYGKYSAAEKAVKILCKEKNTSHEVVFVTDHIKLKDYLEKIVFYEKEQYDLFKNMKGIKFKNKMVYAGKN